MLVHLIHCDVAMLPNIGHAVDRGVDLQEVNRPGFAGDRLV